LVIINIEHVDTRRRLTAGHLVQRLADATK
jgi:hypothetical protein